MPRRFVRLIERVTSRDRDHFRWNPSARSYERVYVPGEFWPAAPRRHDRVTVYGWGAAGIRLRRMGSLAVVDLDSPEAQRLARYFLPRPLFAYSTTQASIEEND